MNFKKLFLWMGVGILISFLYFISYAPRSDDNNIRLARVKKIDFDIQVNTVGVLDAARFHTVSSEIRGNKGKIISLIEDGKRVGKGDILVRFDPTPFETEILSLSGEVSAHAAVLQASEQLLKWEKSQVAREIKVAEFELSSARLELKEMRHGEGPMRLAQFESDMEDAKQEYQKHESFLKELKKLKERGFSNPTEISQAEEKVLQLKRVFEISKRKYDSFREYLLPSQIENAEAKVQRSRMELEQAKKSGSYKIGKAMAAVKKARLQLKNVEEKQRQSQRELDKTVVTAPFSGIAVLFESFMGDRKRKPRIGDAVWQNKPILYLPDISSFIVKTKVREVDLYKVRKNQAVNICADAYPDMIFTGRVLSIGALAEKTRDLGMEKYFQVTISVGGQDQRLRPGMTARVAILSERVKDVLSIPIQSVFSEGKGKFCYRYNDGYFEKTPVEIGAQNEYFAEIATGLEHEDRVSLTMPDPDKVKTALTPAPDRIRFNGDATAHAGMREEARIVRKKKPDPIPVEKKKKKSVQDTRQPDADKKSVRISKLRSVSEHRRPAARQKMSYSVQAGICHEKRNAESMVSELRRKGYEAYLFEAYDSKKQKWFAVRTGDYADLKTASRAAFSFRKRENTKPVVTRINSLRPVRIKGL
ncbi:SPOR domain-containing protein [Desulfobacterales bacterium HSG2]|nr:SPOR domain-containing protein [Desulfobacterales bacterium HSG2]